jgi:hypothetical protein
LPAAQFVEFDSVHAATEHAAEQGVVAVANQMNRLHHG